MLPDGHGRQIEPFGQPGGIHGAFGFEQLDDGASGRAAEGAESHASFLKYLFYKVNRRRYTSTR